MAKDYIPAPGSPQWKESPWKEMIEDGTLKNRYPKDETVGDIICQIALSDLGYVFVLIFCLLILPALIWWLR